ncbi:MAG: hypothetical protein LBB77_00610, partial [Treponema sp.]|nr:hypothetical protein [Treponema sp.]
MRKAGPRVQGFLRAVPRPPGSLVFFLILLLLGLHPGTGSGENSPEPAAPAGDAVETANLAAFADPARIWG